MRVLFTCVAAEGHFRPLLPLARAFRDRGDEVAFATAATFRTVSDEGFSHHAAGIDQSELERRFASRRVELAAMPPAERRGRAFAWRFAELDAPARVDDLLRVAEAFAPDLVVHEAAELAAPAVASKLQVRSVQHGFGRPLPREALDGSTPAVLPMWERLGLEPAPRAGMFRGPVVDIAPPSLTRPVDAPLVLPLRPAERAARVPRERPLVYVTLGTAYAAQGFQLLLDALAPLEVDVLLTTGRSTESSTLRPPANARVEQFVPQSETLPRADVVLSHGGSGTLLGTLAHGVPLVIAPSWADQFDNAQATSAVGAARVLMPDELSERTVREAVGEVLANGAYRDAAERIATEIAAMPSAADVATRLAEL